MPLSEPIEMSKKLRAIRVQEFLRQNEADIHHVAMAVFVVVLVSPMGLGGSAAALAAWTVA